MRARNRYSIPVSDGVDPAGWTAGLRHYVDSRYRLYQSGSFSSALRSAVTNLRKTNLPVGITVSHGNHAWVLTGFTATADPAKTSRFTVTSVRVVGPLWGLQSRSYGYDMRPDRRLTPSQLKGFFTPWHYGRVRMAWEGKWVSVQPVASTIGEGAGTEAEGGRHPATDGPADRPTDAGPDARRRPRSQRRARSHRRRWRRRSHPRRTTWSRSRTCRLPAPIAMARLRRRRHRRRPPTAALDPTLPIALTLLAVAFAVVAGVGAWRRRSGG